jgi:hypothetical protein
MDLPVFRLNLLRQISTRAAQWLARWRSLLSVVLLSLLLTGCVDYRVGVQFDNPYHGQLVQHIRLASQLTNSQTWLDRLENQAKRLGGRTQRLSPQELDLAIPFGNGADLEHKFNQLASTAQLPSQPQPILTSQFHLTSSNLLLLERKHLTYDLDLTSFGLSGTDEAPLPFDPTAVLHLEFGISAPWGAKVKVSPSRFSPPSQAQNQSVSWILQPGQVNHLEAVFWLPSPLGLGTIAIVGLVAAGLYYTRRQPAA